MTATILQDRQAVRAQGIIERHEAHLRDDGSWQVRDTQGSGRWHVVLDGHCDCPDYVYRGVTCKHLRAVLQEERELAQFCESWNARSEQQRQDRANSHAFDRRRDHSPQCPDCGAQLGHAQFYMGGKGYKLFLVCSEDAQHWALPA